MELGLGMTRHGEEEVKAADHANIRFFIVKQQSAYSPAKTPQGRWEVCSPKSVSRGGGFSAVAYFFGRKLENELRVPIGLVEDCVGGTPAETWMSPESLRKIGDFDAQLAEVDRLRARGGPEYGNFIMHWYDEFDIGLKGKTWAAADLDDAEWKAVEIPGDYHELGVAGVPSVCWFRKEIMLPDPLPAGKAFIFLGSIEKMDTTWINGQWVGASSWVENPRVYAINQGVLKPGRNVLTIRDFRIKANGGFLAKPAVLRLVLGDKSEIALAGEWKGKLSVDARPPHPMPLGFENYPTMPSVLFEGMIEPVAPLGITGAIWYQGEANADRAYQYRSLLPAMIGDWRAAFGQGDFPFYIVSLPAFAHRRDKPGDDPWAELREAQALTARSVANSGLAVTIDTGDPDSLHPRDKIEVGERLALVALAKHYGEKIAYSGPTFAYGEIIPGAMKLHFDHVDGGLVVKGEKLEEFSIAGEDRRWYWADAKIEGDTVIVSSAQVPEPKAVRYAWQSNPLATLFNGAGLPAGPFRTDDWAGMTEGRKTPS